MKLVYENNPQREVKIGDTINVDGALYHVEHFAKPRTPNSSGKVTLRIDGQPASTEVFVSIIGARWIEREDRPYIDVTAALHFDSTLDTIRELDFLATLARTKHKLESSALEETHNVRN